MALITGLDLVLGEGNTVEWDLKIQDAEKIDCYPDENGASAENCAARGCAWEVPALTVSPHVTVHNFVSIALVLKMRRKKRLLKRPEFLTGSKG